MKIEDDSIRIMGEVQFDRPIHFSELSTADVNWNFSRFTQCLKLSE